MSNTSAPTDANRDTLDKKHYVVQPVDDTRVQVVYKNWCSWYVYKNLDSAGKAHPKAGKSMWNPTTHERLTLRHPNRMLMMGYKLTRRFMPKVPKAQLTLPGMTA
jgi:hypothetical protein